MLRRAAVLRYSVGAEVVRVVQRCRRAGHAEQVVAGGAEQVLRHSLQLQRSESEVVHRCRGAEVVLGCAEVLRYFGTGWCTGCAW